MAGGQKLGLFLENIADGLLVESCGIGYIGLGVVEGLLLDVAVKPQRHTVVVHRFRQRWASRLPTRTACIATSDHPKGDSLAMDG